MMNTSIKAVTECSNCNVKVDHKWLLHHVRLRGIHRRLCTSCVLKLHPGSFCPTCFDLFETLPPFHRRVICQKCPSISHPNCIPTSENNKAYTCPPCASPNYSFFEIKKKSDESNGDDDGYGKMIDKKAATVLLCAARIAAVSMSKAIVVARADAERRVREAAVCRKRAREALDLVASVTAKEKARRYAEGSGSGSSSAHVGGKGKNLPSMADQKQIESKAKMVDSFRKVSSNSDNNGGSREKHELSSKIQASGLPKNSDNNLTTMAVQKQDQIVNKVISDTVMANSSMVSPNLHKTAKNSSNNLRTFAEQRQDHIANKVTSDTVMANSSMVSPNLHKIVGSREKERVPEGINSKNETLGSSLKNGGNNLATLVVQKQIGNKETMDTIVGSSCKSLPNLVNSVGSGENETAKEEFNLKSETLASPKNGGIHLQNLAEQKQIEDEVIADAIVDNSYKISPISDNNVTTFEKEAVPKELSLKNENLLQTNNGNSVIVTEKTQSEENAAVMDTSSKVSPISDENIVYKGKDTVEKESILKNEEMGESPESVAAPMNEVETEKTNMNNLSTVNEIEMSENTLNTNNLNTDDKTKRDHLENAITADVANLNNKSADGGHPQHTETGPGNESTK